MKKILLAPLVLCLIGGTGLAAAQANYQYKFTLSGIKPGQESLDKLGNLSVSTSESSINSSNTSSFPITISGLHVDTESLIVSIGGQVTDLSSHLTAATIGSNGQKSVDATLNLTSIPDGTVNFDVSITANGYKPSSTSMSLQKNSSSNGYIAMGTVTSDDFLSLAERGTGESNVFTLSGFVESDYNTGTVSVNVGGVVYTDTVSPSKLDFHVDVPGYVLASDHDRIISVSAQLTDQYGTSINSSVNKSFQVENRAYPSLSAVSVLSADKFFGNRIYSADRAPAAFDGNGSYDPAFGQSKKTYARGFTNQGVTNNTAGIYLGVNFGELKTVHGFALSYPTLAKYRPNRVQIQISSDGSSWTTVHDFYYNTSMPYFEMLFDGTYEAQYMRLYHPEGGRAYLQTHDISFF